MNKLVRERFRKKGKKEDFKGRCSERKYFIRKCVYTKSPFNLLDSLSSPP